MRRERRRERRVKVSRRATLIDSGAGVPCLLQDFTTKGFFIISNRSFSIGQLLELRCELYPGKPLQCQVEVKHISETCVGTQIIEISQEGSALLHQFLQEYYSHKLNQSG